MEIITQNTGNDYTILLIGRLDANVAHKAEKTFQEVADKAGRVTLDCRDLEYLSSSGIRAIHKLCQNMKKKNCSLIARGIRPEIKEIFEMTGFAAIMQFE